MIRISPTNIIKQRRDYPFWYGNISNRLYKDVLSIIKKNIFNNLDKSIAFVLYED